MASRWRARKPAATQPAAGFDVPVNVNNNYYGEATKTAAAFGAGGGDRERGRVGRRGGESPGLLEERLRLGEPPVLVRVKEDRVLVDLRTVSPSEDAPLREALATALREGSARRAA